MRRGGRGAPRREEAGGDERDAHRGDDEAPREARAAQALGDGGDVARGANAIDHRAADEGVPEAASERVEREAKTDERGEEKSLARSAHHDEAEQHRRDERHGDETCKATHAQSAEALGALLRRVGR